MERDAQPCASSGANNAMSDYPRVIWRLSPSLRNNRRIALTFDDGPHPIITPQLFDLFDHPRRSSDIFSCRRPRCFVGPSCERIAAAGHTIGSHGWAHRRDWWSGMRTLGDDLDRAEAVLDHYLGAPKLFRPPYGALGPTRYRAARKRGYTIALWNATVRDWTTSDTNRIERALRRRRHPSYRPPS